MNDKVVVGHSLKDDFEHLKLNEDEYCCQIRDIADISFFMRKKEAKTNSPNSSPIQLASQESMGSNNSFQMPKFGSVQKRKLKELAEEFLNAKIQQGHHSSIIDARVALALYRTFQ